MPSINTEGATKALADLAIEETVKHQLASMGLGGLELDVPDGCAVIAKGLRSQSDFAGMAMNLGHRAERPMTADLMNSALRVAFPDHKIGDRHGAHFLSYARTGKLANMRDDLPPIVHARRKKAAAKFNVLAFLEAAECEHLTDHAELMGLDKLRAKSSDGIIAHLEEMIKADPDWGNSEVEQDISADLAKLKGEEPKVVEEAPAPTLTLVEDPKPEPEFDAEALEAELMAMGRPDLVQLAKSEGVNAGGKTPAIVQRIVKHRQASL